MASGQNDGQGGGQHAAGRSAEAWLAAARACEREGELFRAYDIAMQGLAEHTGDLALAYRAVLCLASSGATGQAAAKFAALGLERAGEEAGLAPRLALDIASLRARLLKDAALMSAVTSRPARLVAAAEAYEAAYRKALAAGNPDAYFPAINAATLRLLAGERAAAATRAREVLDLLAAHPEGRTGYYELASALEAHLVLGDDAAAREAAAAAGAANRRQGESDYRALASTLRQLRRIVAATGIDGDILAPLRPPRVVHYAGHIIAPPGRSGRFPAAQEDTVRAAIAAALPDDIGSGYGSLAAGADILFAEALLERGVGLDVVLPFDREEFVEISVRPAGDGWVERFERCIARAASVRFATTDSYLGDDRLFAYCSRLAMGLALLRAGHLESTAEQLVVWDGQPSGGVAGTAADVAVWRGAGHKQHIIPVAGAVAPGEAAEAAAPPSAGGRQPRAMLFGDVKGFSKLDDSELPRFVEALLGGIAGVVDRYAADIRLANTWGDGLFLVLDDAGKAASCALDLQEAETGLDLAAAGLPLHLALRLGGHLGPVYAARDPILKRDNFFGAHVSRAARIEPVTPEGCVYVTEMMAAELALSHPDDFVCEYVGLTEAAKHYGAMRMFLLRRAAAAE